MILQLLEHSLTSAACALPPHDRMAVFFERGFGQRFGENIRHLVRGGRSVHDDVFMLDMLTEVVKGLIDMFGAWAHFGRRASSSAPLLSLKTVQ